MAGGMAALFKPTNVDGIYQIDLLATDLPRPRAFPTYLFYNPFQSAQCVKIDSGLARTQNPSLAGRPLGFYDLVSKSAPVVGGCAKEFSRSQQDGRPYSQLSQAMRASNQTEAGW